MSHRPIMDAGPGINFFSLHKERLLFHTLGPLCVPEAVETEVLRKSGQDVRFADAARVWNKLPTRLMKVLSDDVTDELAAAVGRITEVPFAQRRQISKDFGETMVIAHAAVAAQRGDTVIILIDDSDGRRKAAAERRRLERLRTRHDSVGRIDLISTLTVLERAAGKDYLPNRNSMRNLYERLRKLDDGLPPLSNTNLMGTHCWR